MLWLGAKTFPVTDPEELKARLDMLYDMFDIHCKGTNEIAHRLEKLEQYVVDELEAAKEMLEKNRAAMYAWAADAHNDIEKFKEKLYKRRRDGV